MRFQSNQAALCDINQYPDFFWYCIIFYHPHIVSMSIEALKKMLARGQDSMILRFGLGQALLKSGQASEAVDHLSAALKFDPEYSAAWKLLGKAQAEIGAKQQAIETYEKGIAVAELKGDIQAAKEMRVFLKRLLK